MNGMAQDPATGDVYFVSGSGIAWLRRLNANGTLESLVEFGGVLTDTLYARPMAFDPKRGRLLSFGINGTDRGGYLWNGTTMQRIAFTGLADAFNGSTSSALSTTLRRTDSSSRARRRAKCSSFIPSPSKWPNCLRREVTRSRSP
jgi:hypothetical protein